VCVCVFVGVVSVSYAGGGMVVKKSVCVRNENNNKTLLMSVEKSVKKKIKARCNEILLVGKKKSGECARGCE